MTVVRRWVPEAGGAGTGQVPVPWPDGGPGGVARAVVLAAHACVVSRLAGESEVTVGTPDGAATVPVTGTWRQLVEACERAVPVPGSTVDTGVDVATGALVTVCGPAGSLCLRYDRECFDEAYARRVAGYLGAALAAAVSTPDGVVSDVDLIGAAEREHLVFGLRGAERVLPDRRFTEIFADVVRDRPDAVAAVCGDEQWTYQELDRAANRVAGALVAAGLAAEDVVIVLADRTLPWLAAVIGVLRAGGVYLPVDPEYPPARVQALAERSGCRYALVEPGAGAPVEHVLELATVLAGGADTDPGVAVGADQLAYIYFTSGSTGQPKGAMCEHLGMLNHLTAKVDDLELGPGDVVIQNAQPTFDISLWQLLAPLMVGGRTAIVSRTAVLDPRRFLDEVVGYGATVLQLVPSYLDVLLRHVEAEPRDLGPLRVVSVTGEAIPRPLVVRWFAAYPHIALVNAYGATEASDDTTHEVMLAPPVEELVPVGRPVGNVTVYVLGPGQSLVPLGAPGEIAFAGCCVGRGYINDPERTAEVFVADPFQPGRRMYRTGDFGRWLPDGSLEFAGRRDEQVKVNGIRIELGEVEHRLLDHDGVLTASVVAVALPGTGKALVGFYEGTAEPGDVRDHLSRVLPATAVPARLHRIGALPLTGNGKVDKKALSRLATLDLQERGGDRPAPAVALGATGRRIAAAWAQALDQPGDAIGPADHFFDIGGGSLSALRVVADLDGLITLPDLLSNPALAELESLVDGRG